MNALPQSAPPILSILIVSYNGRRFIPDCLGSLRERVSLPHEVILVDNGSADGSADLVRAEYPEVRLIAESRNHGFTRANNLAAREARGAYLLLLNTDTVLLDDPAPAVALLEHEPGIGVVGARMVDAQRTYRPSAGHFPRPGRLIRIRSMYRCDGPFASGRFPERPGSYTVDWVEGSFLLTRASLWRQVGGLDQDYFMYVEDVDYCRAALEAGYRTVFCPRVDYIHFGGFDIGRMAWTVSGFRRYHRKHSPRGERWLAEAVLSSGLLARSLVSGARWLATRQEEHQAKMRVCWQALSGRTPDRPAGPARGGDEGGR